MPDALTKRKRPEVMSRIRGRGNKETELALAGLLRQFGITGWRRQQVIKVLDEKQRAQRSHPTNIRTDFIFPKQRVALFVDGCFWHGCPKHCNPMKWLKNSLMPANNLPSPRLQRTGRAFWKKKVTGNNRRDRFVNRQLRRAGWRVVRIWEHELQKRMRVEGRRMKVVEKIRQALERS